MGRALHVVEDALAAVRAGKQAVTPKLVTNCLASIDQVSAWLNAMEAAENVPSGADAEADRLIALFSASSERAPAMALAEGTALARAHDLIEAQLLLVAEKGGGEEGRLVSALRVGENVLRSVGAHAEADSFAALAKGHVDAEAATRALHQALKVLASGDAPSPAAASARAEGAARALRIDAARIDALVKLTGELTTTDRK